MKPKISNLSLNMLVALDAICRLRSTTKAADELCISQPSVSSYIKRLKDEFGDDIFLRTPQGLEPTEKGMQLWGYAIKILDLCSALSETEDRVFDPTTERASFKIAVPTWSASQFTETLFIPIKNKYPQIDINLIGLDRDSAIDGLTNKSVDLYIGYKPEQLSYNLHSHEARTEAFHILCSSRSKLYKQSHISREDFVEEPHIKVHCRVAESYLDLVLSERNILQRHLYSVPDNASALAALKQTNHLLIASDFIVESFQAIHADIKELKPKDFSIPPVTFHQIWHTYHENSPAHKWLRNYVSQQNQ